MDKYNSNNPLKNFTTKSVKIWLSGSLKWSGSIQERKNSIYNFLTLHQIASTSSGVSRIMQKKSTLQHFFINPPVFLLAWYRQPMPVGKPRSSGLPFQIRYKYSMSKKRKVIVSLHNNISGMNIKLQDIKGRSSYTMISFCLLSNIISHMFSLTLSAHRYARMIFKTMIC